MTPNSIIFFGSLFSIMLWREYSLFNSTGYIHGPAYMMVLQENIFGKVKVQYKMVGLSFRSEI